MNITYCQRDQKAIRNWVNQCCFCAHGHLVIFRGRIKGGQKIEYSGLYLFQCPHVRMRHKKVGQDPHHSLPRTNTDLVLTSLRSIYLSPDIEKSLEWRIADSDVADSIRFSGDIQIEMAEIPRERWLELLYIDIPLPPPCPECGYEVPSPSKED